MTKAIPSRAKAFAMHSRANEQSNLVQASGIKEAMIRSTGTGKKRKKQQTEGDEDEYLTAQERIEAVLNLPNLDYTISPVKVIIANNRRIEMNIEEEDTEHEPEDQEAEQQEEEADEMSE